MKTNQTLVIAITAALFFTLAGCDSKGGLELKEPYPELKGDGMRWTINGPVDEEGNLLVPEETD